MVMHQLVLRPMGRHPPCVWYVGHVYQFGRFWATTPMGTAKECHAWADARSWVPEDAWLVLVDVPGAMTTCVVRAPSKVEAARAAWPHDLIPGMKVYAALWSLYPGAASALRLGSPARKYGCPFRT